MDRVHQLDLDAAEKGVGEAWSTIGVGVTLAVLSIGLFMMLRTDIAKLNAALEAQGKQIAALRERMAHLEGLLEGLRGAISGRRASADQAIIEAQAAVTAEFEEYL